MPHFEAHRRAEARDRGLRRVRTATGWITVASAAGAVVLAGGYAQALPGKTSSSSTPAKAAPSSAAATSPTSPKAAATTAPAASKAPSSAATAARTTSAAPTTSAPAPVLQPPTQAPTTAVSTTHATSGGS